MNAFSRSLLVLASLVIPAATAHAATELKFGGFVKAAVIGSDREVNSLGYNNLSAPTAAHPKDLLVGGAPENDNGAVSFQTAQSRLNMTGEIDQIAKAYIELDFFDASKSTPFTQQVPRVRIAKGEVRLSENLLFVAGQDWDVFGPVNTYTYNYTGNSFQAGNSGFMRQQMVLNQTTEFGLLRYAIGQASANAGSYTPSSIGDAEHSNWPSVSFSAEVGKPNDRFGLSALYGHLTLTNPIGTSYSRTDRDSYGVNLFAEKPVGAISFRGELYWGQDLANTGALTLSQGTIAAALKEYGGFISAKWALTETSSIFGTAGFAQITNDSDVAAQSATVIYPEAALAGMKSNFAAKLGYDHKFSEHVTVFGEASRFESNYAGLGNAASWVAEAGLFVQL